jgi:hypothetical protein
MSDDKKPQQTEAFYTEHWVVRHCDGSYLTGAFTKNQRWAFYSLTRSRFATKEAALAARDEMREHEKRCSHTAKIVKVRARH